MCSIQCHISAKIFYLRIICTQKLQTKILVLMYYLMTISYFIISFSSYRMCWLFYNVIPPVYDSSFHFNINDKNWHIECLPFAIKLIFELKVIESQLECVQDAPYSGNKQKMSEFNVKTYFWIKKTIAIKTSFKMN